MDYEMVVQMADYLAVQKVDVWVLLLVGSMVALLVDERAVSTAAVRAEKLAIDLAAQTVLRKAWQRVVSMEPKSVSKKVRA